MKQVAISRVALIYTIGILLLLTYGCTGSNDKNNPSTKSQLSINSNEYKNIYSVLEDYPGVEQFFTYGDLEISKFENILFGEFLGKDSTTDLLVSMIDMFPHLIDTGTYTSPIFSADVQTKMESKGPVPDLVSTIAAFTDNIVSVEDAKINPFYDYLNKLGFMGNNIAGNQTLTDYTFDILIDLLNFLSTLDKDSINLFMNYFIADLTEMKIVKDGNFDFVDIEALLEKFALKSPEGLIEVLEAVRMLIYDKEFKQILSELFANLGSFFGDDDLYPVIKELRLKRYDLYNPDSLGKFFDRMWTKGPEIGPQTEAIGIEKYGKDGKAEIAVLDYLKLSNVIAPIFEVLYNMQQDGVEFDEFDKWLKIVSNSDSFTFDRKGEGEFGNGQFYEPNEHLSFKDFSWVYALFGLLGKINMPTGLTMPFIYEGEGQEETKTLIRTLIPEADTFPVAGLIWYKKYEKHPDRFIGNGKPVTEKDGYGTMIDGHFFIPTPSDIPTLLDILLYLLGTTSVNGPYDNIYDNLNWAYYKRKIFFILDIVTVSEYIPVLKNTILPLLKMAGIKTLPIQLAELNGARDLLFLELRSILEELPKNLTKGLSKSDMPEWMVKTIINTINRHLPLGAPHGTEKIYLLPEIVRDGATTTPSMAFFDPAAFCLEKLLDKDHPENYKNFYDVSEYTYDKNKDKANRFWSVFSAVAISFYSSYNEVMRHYPSSISDVKIRREAALAAWGSYFPTDSLANVISMLSEINAEEDLYGKPASEIMPFFKTLEPLIDMKSHGVIDKSIQLMAELGKPELKAAREKLFSGIANVLSTVDRDSTWPYTYAAALIENTKKAMVDARRWDHLKLTMDTLSNILSSDSTFEIVTDVLALIDHLTGIDTSNDDWSKVSEGIVDILQKSTEDKIITRSLFHITTILEKTDDYHLWKGAIDVGNEMIMPGGLLDYLLRGMERNPEDSWEVILLDVNEFLHSELMKDYSEGSFWKDIYYLLNFLADAIETVE